MLNDCKENVNYIKVIYNTLDYKTIIKICVLALRMANHIPPREVNYPPVNLPISFAEAIQCVPKFCAFLYFG